MEKIFALCLVGLVLLTTNNQTIPNPNPPTASGSTSSTIEQIEKLENEKKHKKLFYKQILKELLDYRLATAEPNEEIQFEFQFSDDFFPQLIQELETEVTNPSPSEQITEKKSNHKYFPLSEYNKLIREIESASKYNGL